MVSVIISTCNRGSAVTATIESVLACTHSDFEVIIVDQSDDDSTRLAVAPYLSDPRVVYTHSAIKGLGRARNTGADIARSDVLCFTDDDCSVAPNWLQTIDDAFRHNPAVALVFSRVVAAPHDPKLGFVPVYAPKGTRLITNCWEKLTAGGIGASFAMRRLVLQEIGGFDELLGPGAPFPACEDGDITVRALLRGYQVLDTDQTEVVHFGFRYFHEGKALAQRNWYGVGAAYAKPLKAGHPGFIIVSLYEFITKGLIPPLRQLLTLRKPTGITVMTAFVRGFAAGLRHPIDRATIRFVSAK